MVLGDTERNRAAVHEAGHALVAASRGLGVAVIELHSLDGEGGMRLREEPAALDRVWVLYGGPLAEKVAFNRLASAAVPPEHDELLLAYKLCQQIGISDTIGMMDQVEACLCAHRVLLERVATRLLEVNTLQGADLDQLLGEKFPGTRHGGEQSSTGGRHMWTAALARAVRGRLPGLPTVTSMARRPPGLWG
jgi:ATP-dependent Zn protease